MKLKTFLELKWLAGLGSALGRILLPGFAAVFVLACGIAYAADSVGLVDSQKIMFQHPGFDEASKIIIFLSRALEGGAPQILTSERDPERREMIMKFSTQVTEFAQLDRAIAAENDIEKKTGLWEERQNKLSEFEVGLMRPIMEECRQAIQTVMTLKQMTVVIELDSVYYGGTDITEEVIQHLRRTARR